MKKRISKELVAACSRPLVLSILASGNKYGYEILKELKHLSDGDLQWSGGMIYPLLHRLERDGFVESHWEVTDEARPRKYYRLTNQGLGQLSTDRERAGKECIQLSRYPGEAAVCPGYMTKSAVGERVSQTRAGSRRSS